MKKRKGMIITLDEFIEKHYGKIGTPKRDKFEAGYQKFKNKVLKKL
ncbi:hypothetical protein IR010_14800 [Flavobacterium sp. MR2016-29]|nr:hypothetical protein [Flavobacterium sp. MR2016-29]MBF4493815.1 hypothetical protein [Flavobacterium sp. MR2016-29]